MGRCYEFGVEIHAGCEQAMIVTPSGGACHCRTCREVCPGRFAGCAAVIAVPGRVPPSAPEWAVNRPGQVDAAGAREPAPAPPTTIRRLAVPAAKPRVPAAKPRSRPATDPAQGEASLSRIQALVVDLAAKLSNDPSTHVLDAVEALSKELVERDNELRACLDAIADRHSELQAEMARVNSTVARMAHAVAPVQRPTVWQTLREMLVGPPSGPRRGA